MDLQALLDAIPTPVFFKDPSGVYLGCNAACEEFLGRPRAEIIGKTPHDLVPKEIADVYRRTDQALLASPGEVQVYEGSALDSAGVRRDFEFHKTAVRSDDGRVIGLVGVGVDVTERRRAETALRASEQRFRLLAEHVSDVITLQDRDLRSLYISPSVLRQRGFTVEEALAQTLAERMTPESFRQLMETLAQELERDRTGRADPDRVVVVELELYRKDGSTFWAEVTVRATHGPAGKISGFVSVTRDITDRKRVEEAERRAEALRGVARLANAAAHEINNPLSVVLGRLQLLEAQQAPGSPAHADIEQALAACRRIEAVVRHIGRVSRLEAVERWEDATPMLDIRKSSAALPS
jgi:PAS domain S-box-containing protein